MVRKRWDRRIVLECTMSMMLMLNEQKGQALALRIYICGDVHLDLTQKAPKDIVIYAICYIYSESKRACKTAKCCCTMRAAQCGTVLM